MVARPGRRDSRRPSDGSLVEDLGQRLGRSIGERLVGPPLRAEPTGSKEDHDPVRPLRHGIQRWDSFDTLLFDRETYEQWADFWPLSQRTSGEHPWFRQMSDFAEMAQKVVLSESPVPTSWANTRVLTGDRAEAVDRMRKEPGQNIVAVAPKLGRELMRRGLIDEYLFAVLPVILGSGHRFFAPLEGQGTLRLVEVKQFRAGELFLHYESARGGS